MPFSFMTATSIRFGRNVARASVSDIAALGKTVLLVHGSSAARAEWLVEAVQAKGCGIVLFSCPGEPDLALVETGVALARDQGVDNVVSLGGGSVIDCGKAIAALVPATRPVMDHLEVVGMGLPLDHPSLPFAALPTTAGTGAEVTKNAVIAIPSHGRKVSLRDDRMFACLAIVDPALTDECPRHVTLASGLDAVTQVIEPYVSSKANRMSDALCRGAIATGLGALGRLMDDPSDKPARDDMAWVSLCGGLALANAGLGAVHGLAGPIGGMSPAPHGAVCGALLPHVLAANASMVTGAKRQRFGEISGWIADALGGGPATSFAKLAQWSRDAGLPGLQALGVNPQDHDAIVAASLSSSSMKGNPVSLDAAVLKAILAKAN